VRDAKTPALTDAWLNRVGPRDDVADLAAGLDVDAQDPMWLQ
jgi:hypothetical protein